MANFCKIITKEVIVLLVLIFLFSPFTFAVNETKENAKEEDSPDFSFFFTGRTGEDGKLLLNGDLLFADYLWDVIHIQTAFRMNAGENFQEYGFSTGLGFKLGPIIVDGFVEGLLKDGFTLLQGRPSLTMRFSRFSLTAFYAFPISDPIILDQVSIPEIWCDETSVYLSTEITTTLLKPLEYWGFETIIVPFDFMRLQGEGLCATGMDAYQFSIGAEFQLFDSLILGAGWEKYHLGEENVSFPWGNYESMYVKLSIPLGSDSEIRFSNLDYNNSTPYHFPIPVTVTHTTKTTEKVLDKLMVDVQYDSWCENTKVVYHISIRGGEGPYTVVMKFGDGTSEILEQVGNNVEIVHIYPDFGKYCGQLVVNDARGCCPVTKCDCVQLNPCNKGYELIYDSCTNGKGEKGRPGIGSYLYAAGTVLDYIYSLRDGYTNLSVKLDGVPVSFKGKIVMNQNHHLNTCSTKVNCDKCKDLATSQTTWTGLPSDGFSKDWYLINTSETCSYDEAPYNYAIGPQGGHSKTCSSYDNILRFGGIAPKAMRHFRTEYKNGTFKVIDVDYNQVVFSKTISVTAAEATFEDRNVMCTYLQLNQGVCNSVCF
ncbi:MAG: hypothetical protein PHT54_02075 [Candidatus Nanoarchaeia archaeon]|nr:hypothetical protein [Candidatus Nanoarchaeia archaeon]